MRRRTLVATILVCMSLAPLSSHTRGEDKADSGTVITANDAPDLYARRGGRGGGRGGIRRGGGGGIGRGGGGIGRGGFGRRGFSRGSGPRGFDERGFDRLRSFFTPSLTPAAESHGILQIQLTTEDAEIYVDGKFIGLTRDFSESAVVSVPSGDHVVEFRQGGSGFTDNVYVAPSGSTIMRIGPKPNSQSLQESPPSGNEPTSD